MPAEPAALIDSVVDKYDAELVELRRDLHAHPELSWSESRTTDLVAERVEQAGWRVTRVPRSGFVACGRDAQSIAFLSTPGIDALYSGVATRTASASASASRSERTASGPPSTSSSTTLGW